MSQPNCRGNASLRHLGVFASSPVITAGALAVVILTVHLTPRIGAQIRGTRRVGVIIVSVVPDIRALLCFVIHPLADPAS